MEAEDDNDDFIASVERAPLSSYSSSGRGIGSSRASKSKYCAIGGIGGRGGQYGYYGGRNEDTHGGGYSSDEITEEDSMIITTSNGLTVVRPPPDTLLCVCQSPYDSRCNYLICEECGSWFHGRCVGISVAKQDQVMGYVCKKCTSKSGKTTRWRTRRGRNSGDGK